MLRKQGSEDSFKEMTRILSPSALWLSFGPVLQTTRPLARRPGRLPPGRKHSPHCRGRGNGSGHGLESSLLPEPLPALLPEPLPKTQKEPLLLPTTPATSPALPGPVSYFSFLAALSSGLEEGCSACT